MQRQRDKKEIEERQGGRKRERRGEKGREKTERERQRGERERVECRNVTWAFVYGLELWLASSFMPSRIGLKEQS